MSVSSVSTSSDHTFYKSPTTYIYCLASQGVQGDIHCAASPTSSKKQIHLIDAHLLSKLHSVPGELGENVLTSGVDLLSLVEGTKLHFSSGAVVNVTGIREPRKRLEEWPDGVLERLNKKGRGVGVYGTVERDGYIQIGDSVTVEIPKGGRALGRV